MKRLMTVVGLSMLATVSGCSSAKERFGRTWYIDGAGNWGFGALDVPVGLEEAGYKGLVTNHRWSLTLNPALDQTLRFLAKGSGKLLGSEITSYLRRNPDAEANIIALSAGTGVGVWAIEAVEPPYKVNNFIMLGSSLSSRYDMRRALRNMKGDVYVYFAASDPVLTGPVRALGTIDGTFDDSAGLIGLRNKNNPPGRIKNIGWTRQYTRYGWTGGHADCVTKSFVKAVLAKRIIPRRSQVEQATHREEDDPPGATTENRRTSASRRLERAAHTPE